MYKYFKHNISGNIKLYNIFLTEFQTYNILLLYTL